MMLRSHSFQRGFTLLELMIVVLLAGIVVSMVAFDARPNPASQLREDAVKLAQTLRVAHDEAQLGGLVLHWQGDVTGWRFALPALGESGPVLREDVFRPYAWSSRLDSLRWTGSLTPPQTPADAAGTVHWQLAQEEVSLAYALQLERQGWQITISSDGLGHFAPGEPQRR